MAAPVITTSFTADVQNGNPPFDVQFTDTTQITDGFARFWFWEFGDGFSARGIKAKHSYSKNGDYQVALMVFDEFGANSRFTKTITVSLPVSCGMSGTTCALSTATMVIMFLGLAVWWLRRRRKLDSDS